MHPFSSPGDVETHLREMAARPAPYVRQLPKRPREQSSRWCHLFDGGVEGERLHAEATGAAPRPVEAIPSAPDPVLPIAAAPPAVASSTPVDADARDDLRDRLAQLEDEVSELRARLDRLEG
jgi:uncharacterized protein YceH (UPF0502 family)